MSETKSGVLILNKPCGITSHDAVNRIRRIYGTKKVGHTGTLDPMATGVLPILVGNAVKASEYLVSDSKQYTARLRLGIETDTEDTSGRVISESDNIPDDISKIAASFLGGYAQVPPMYSALKVGGEKLCDLARRGIEVEREARDIKIFSISSKKLTDREWEIDTEVSKGTYIRTLVADIGKKAGCGAAMSALERRVSGSFTLEMSHTLDSLEAMSREELNSLLIPTEELFSNLDKLRLPDFYTGLALNGAEIYLSRAKIVTDRVVGDRVRMADSNGNFFALGELRQYESGVAVKPIKFFKEEL